MQTGLLFLRAKSLRQFIPLRGVFLAWVVFCYPQCVEAQFFGNRQLPLDFAPPAELMVRNPNWRTYLTQTKRAIENKRHSEAVELLQHCFDSDVDGFLFREEWPVSSFRGQATALLHEGGEELWQTYETLQGPLARQILNAAQTEGTPWKFLEIIRRFENTTVGAAALDRLANYYLERGDYLSAVNCWQRLIENPVHVNRVSTNLRIKLMLAASRCGKSDLAQQQRDLVGTSKTLIAGQSWMASDWWKRSQSLLIPGTQLTDLWNLFGGAADRLRIHSGSAPILKPHFRVALFDPDINFERNPVTTAGSQPATGTGAIPANSRAPMRNARERLELELKGEQSRALELGFGGSPIVNHRQIIFRDNNGIRSVDRQTGASLWTWETEFSLLNLIQENPPQELNQVSSPEYFRNSTFQQLSSDGQRAFFIDSAAFPFQRGQVLDAFDDAAFRPDGRRPSTPENHLVALNLEAPNGKGRLCWSTAIDRDPSRVSIWKGHFFLGPPLPVGGMLFSVAEFENQLVLIAMTADSGQLIWKQTLGYLPTDSPRGMRVTSPQKRLAQACVLAVSEGTIICPLSSGLIVAVDQYTGAFRWWFDFRYPIKKPGDPPANLTRHFTEEMAEKGDYPRSPMILGDRVYYLAPADQLNDAVHCLDLRTGKLIWQVACPDSKYLALSENVAIVVAAKDAIGLSLKDGSKLWERRITSVSGIGAVLSDLFLVPLADGRVLSLNSATGHDAGLSLRENNIRPGNLLIQGEDIVSFNGIELDVYPQSAALLERLTAQAAARMDRDLYWLELGEVQFRLGQLEEAKTSLNKGLSLAKEESSRSQLHASLRELAWYELTHSTENQAQAIKDLETYSRTPLQKAQYWMARSEFELAQNQTLEARQSLRELSQLTNIPPLAVVADPERRVAPLRWVESQVRSISERESQDPDPSETIILENDPEELERFLSLNPKWAATPRLRLLLAEHKLKMGQAQAAELLVWKDHLGSDTAAVDACLFLIELWDHAGFFEEAGRLVHRMGADLAQVTGSDGRTGIEVMKQFPRDSLVWEASRRFVPLDWKVECLNISEQHELHATLRSTYFNSPRTLNMAPMTHQLNVRGQGIVGIPGQPATNLIQQVDSETGQIVAEISLPKSPGQSFYPIYDTRHRIGHFLPLASSQLCFGLSVLERNIVWDQTGTRDLQLMGAVRVGPCSTDTSVFRSKSKLFAIHPGTGQLLWERNDIEEASRATNGWQTLPGDAEAVVLYDNDTKGYLVYKTSDGSVIRQGRLDDLVYLLRNFGRNLLYSNDATMRGIVLWDPVSNTKLFEAKNMPTTVSLNDREQSFVASMTHPTMPKHVVIKVVNGLTGQSRVEVVLAERDISQGSTVAAFSDSRQFYLNVNSQRVSSNANQVTYANDTVFPTQPIAGDLLAIDPTTFKVIWSRTALLPQSVLITPDYQLPFLVTLSRVRGANRSSETSRLNRKVEPIPSGAIRMNGLSTLWLEVIDSGTGETIATHTNAFNDRLLIANYNRDRGQLRLRGAVTQLTLNFGPEVQKQKSREIEFVKHDR